MAQELVLLGAMDSNGTGRWYAGSSHADFVRVKTFKRGKGETDV